MSAWAPLTLLAQERSSGPILDDLRSVALPERVAWATDVRWLEEDVLLLGVPESGIHSWRLGEQDAELEVTLLGTDHSAPRRQDYGRFGGVPAGGVAFGNGLFGVYLQEPSGIRLLKDVELVGDIDRRGALTAAVGLARTEDRNWEHHVAWLFEGTAVLPLVPTRDEGLAFARSFSVDLSVIRFITDDRVLVVPGAEPGVFVYDGNGVLLESLLSETFSADAIGEIGEAEGLLMTGRSPCRVAWLNRWRVIDEVAVDGAGGIYFFVRSFSAETSGVSGPAAASSRPTAVIDEAARTRAVAADLIQRAKDGKPVQLHVGSRKEADDLIAALRASGEPVANEIAAAVMDMRTRIAAMGPTGSGDPPEAGDYPPVGRVCWDLVHTRLDDFGAVARRPCAIESELGDTRLHADIRGDRAVLLLRSDSFTLKYGRASKILVGRIGAPE